MLGVYDLEAAFDNGRIVSYPNQIFIHPEWSPFVRKYDADLAILETEESIEFNQFVSPICLWNNKENPNALNAFVIGYSDKFKNNTKIQFPRKIDLSIMEFPQCMIKYPDLSRIAAPNTFCAGADDGRNGVCRGDSGHGLIFKYNKKFYLRGITSASLIDDEYKCDYRQFALFTDVLKYKNWIENPSANNGEYRLQNFSI